MTHSFHTPAGDLALEDLVLGDILRQRARTHRGQPFLRTADGDITFSEVDEAANRLAQGLREAGVERGEHVALMMPNGPEIIYSVFALAKLGAVAVPINTGYKGELLDHVLRTSDARTLMCDQTLLGEATASAGRTERLARMVVRTDADRALDSLPLPAWAFDDLLASANEDPRSDSPWSGTQAIMYTSGTTGPSKGVITSHALALSCALDSLRYVNGWGKTYYCCLPFFHAGGLWDGMMAALLSGTPIGIAERFSASRFWDDVRNFGAHVAMSVFAMIPILLNRPPSDLDTDHHLESFYMGKSILDAPMRERFGVRAVETYTSTEAGIPTASPYGEWRLGSCGQENSERFEVAIVDSHDRPVPPGEPGEIVVRPRQPFVITTGYYGFWETTAHCFRNQWFHTGDRAWRDEDGYFFFLDRMKDAIRRRGENISAFDLECQVNLHPAVVESAAIGVPSELEEEEVKVFVVTRPGSSLDPGELADFCAQRLPSFMVPRYVEVVDELPRTPTGKIAKRELRTVGNGGLTATTWDRQAQPSSAPDSPRASEIA